MKKKIITLLLVIISVFVLAACSGGAKKEINLSSENAGNKTEQKFEMELLEQNIISLDSEYWKIGFKVKNNSVESMSTPSVSVDLLDKNGDILDSTMGVGGALIEPGQSATLTCIIEENPNIASVKVSQGTYYDKSNEKIKQFQGTFSNATPLPLQ